MTCRQHRNLTSADADALRQAMINSSKHEYDIDPEAPTDGFHDWRDDPPPQQPKWWWWVAVGLLVCAAYFFLQWAAQAHDHQHPELDEWFRSLTNQQGVPCCDMSEATRLDDVDWDSKCDDGGEKCHYRVHVEGKWWDVPDHAVVQSPNRLGPAMVWPLWYGDGQNPHQQMVVRCFILGAGM